MGTRNGVEDEEGGDVSFEAAATADHADLPLEKVVDGGDRDHEEPRTIFLLARPQSASERDCAIRA